MKMPFWFLSISLFCGIIYLLIINEFSCIDTFAILLFISLLFANIDSVVEKINKLKISEFEVFFVNKNKDDKFFTLAFELLNKNFPKLTKGENRKITKRVNSWLNKLKKELKNEKIDIDNLKVFHHTNFLYVLNKSLDIVGRSENKLINLLLIKYLIRRLKLDRDNNKILRIDDAIINSLQYMTEDHFKLLCLIRFLENVNVEFSNIENLSDFKNYVLAILNNFVVEDYNVCDDLIRMSFINNYGNKKLMYPDDNYRKIMFSQLSGKISRPIMPCNNLLQYFSTFYPFLNALQEEDKKKLINDKTFLYVDDMFETVLIHVQVMDIANIAIEYYGYDRTKKIIDKYKKERGTLCKTHN